MRNKLNMTRGLQHSLHTTFSYQSDLIFIIVFSQIFVILLIFTWLQAADKLNNPFGRDKGYDADLDEVLDTSLWRSSKILQQEHLAATDGNMEFLN